MMDSFPHCDMGHVPFVQQNPDTVPLVSSPSQNVDKYWMISTVVITHRASAGGYCIRRHKSAFKVACAMNVESQLYQGDTGMCQCPLM